MDAVPSLADFAPWLLMQAGEAALPFRVQAVLVAWMLAVGASVGSFVNVVVYRVPAGKSLVHPGSHCPKCGKAIRWHDNIPIFGWLILRGKCRDCKEPISARYPLVELLVAAVFVALAVGQGVSAGGNLPGAWREAPLPSPWLAWGVCLFHAMLLSTLIAAALIEWDGNTPRWRLFAPALLVGFLAPVFLPLLQPVPIQAALDTSRIDIGSALEKMGPHWAAAAGGFVCVWVGGLFGLAVYDPTSRLSKNQESVWSCGLETAAAFVFLGLQAGALAAAVAALLTLLSVLIGRRYPRWVEVPYSAWLAGASLAYILAWAWVVRLAPLQDRGGAPAALLACMVVVIAASRLAAWLTPAATKK